MNTLELLQRWYSANCDGHWEHKYGVSIGTLDNPGWQVTIDLNSTALEGKLFAEVEYGLDRSLDWYRCWKNGSVWSGVGGPGYLHTILSLFILWASESNSADGERTDE